MESSKTNVPRTAKISFRDEGKQGKYRPNYNMGTF